MVSVERGPQEVRAIVQSQPLIYLDQCAIYELSRDNDTRAKRFAEFFNDRGELLLSSINLIEMGQLRGDSLKRVERFLEQVIGPAWIPIEFDFDVVARREHAGAFSPSPAICERLLDDACATDGLPSLSKWIPQYAVSDTPEVRASYAAAKQEAARQIQKLRDEYVADPTVLNRIPRLPRTPRTKTPVGETR